MLKKTVTVNAPTPLDSDARIYAQTCLDRFGSNSKEWVRDFDSFLVSANSPNFFDDSLLILRESGIVTFLSEIPADILSKSVEQMKGLISSARAGSQGLGHVPWRYMQKTDTYRSAMESDIPVVSIREGADGGMVDVFHADAFVKELADATTELVWEANVERMLSEISGEKISFRNFNIYWNEGVRATRGWHVDSYGGRQFKLFIYLTDVLSLADGPYCYVPRSARTPGFEEANRKISGLISAQPTDVNLFDSSEALALIAPRGQVVISNQSGAHRGHPQEAGHFRCIASLNFTRGPA